MFVVLSDRLCSGAIFVVGIIRPIVTEIKEASQFYMAEDYHQQVKHLQWCEQLSCWFGRRAREGVDRYFIISASVRPVFRGNCAVLKTLDRCVFSLPSSLVRRVSRVTYISRSCRIGTLAVTIM